MDIQLGIRVRDGVLLATSNAVTRGISVLKDDDDKTRRLAKGVVMSYSGEAGDTVQFAEYVQANVQLYAMREGADLSPSAIAHFVRLELAKSLRSRKPYQVNVLLGGASAQGSGTTASTPHLYQIDYLGTLVELPYAAHGYAAFYTFSLLDRHYREGMTREEGWELLQLCVDELKRRIPMDFKGITVKTVSADGVVSAQMQ
ncbi:proteasome core particle subunit beta 4 KNAG_0E03620 [Huiozyma naganishii CBS 8797]|uniref:Proteasome subunit beta n=1 Tax=Huiozyma naganishii (strain ATCC MYA-139 / BCRC 22969 / CBS 8797 / KCTC 17520 / NBRC 10181 / NCYC 3082 / Yp74L-3) TaxID=1071383 RepID=J7S6W2_HUIN7|nr:hypothetical protein KNAG_0E03620 [Kazachstania naganishii CBS 8797]CCK70619.1 hypothetical protein KNAG_0E03620 [Kazachstania naganishii CBS 8797]